MSCEVNLFNITMFLSESSIHDIFNNCTVKKTVAIFRLTDLTRQLMKRLNLVVPGTGIAFT